MRRLSPLLPVLLVAACTATPEPTPAATGAPGPAEPLPRIEVPPDPLADFRDLDECAVLDLVEESEFPDCTRNLEEVDGFRPTLDLRLGGFTPELPGEPETVDLGDGLVVHAGGCTPYGRTFDFPLVDGYGLRFTHGAAQRGHASAPPEWVDEHLCAAVPDLARRLEPALRELPRHPGGALADPCAAVSRFTDLVDGGEAHRENRRHSGWWPTIDLCEAVGPRGKVAVHFDDGRGVRPRTSDLTVSGRPVERRESVEYDEEGLRNCSLRWYQRNRADEGSEGRVTVMIGFHSNIDPSLRVFEGDPCAEVVKAAVAVIEELDR